MVSVLWTSNLLEVALIVPLQKKLRLESLTHVYLKMKSGWWNLALFQMEIW